MLNLINNYYFPQNMKPAKSSTPPNNLKWKVSFFPKRIIITTLQPWIKQNKSIDWSPFFKTHLSGIKAAEANDINAALEFFKQAIEEAPQWASAYNNRAQALRLTGDIDGMKITLILLHLSIYTPSYLICQFKKWAQIVMKKMQHWIRNFYA